MKYFEVIPLHNVGKNLEVLIYSSVLPLSRGALVELQLVQKTISGVVIREVPRPKFKTKPIDRRLDEVDLPIHLLEIARWIANYYLVNVGQTLKSMLPKGLGKKRRDSIITMSRTKRENKLHFELTTAQQTVIDEFTKSSSHVQLLEGVTGSGKTRIYIELVKQTMNNGKSAIVLVPEIGLTQQIVSEFSAGIDPRRIVLTHSRLTESERHRLWLRALKSKEPLLVIGPRSALFSPLNNIGLIIVDEAHDASYKQDQQPRYDAIKVAASMSKIANCKLLLGTATPNVADKYQLLELGATAHKLDQRIDNTKLPEVKIVSLSDKDNFGRNTYLCDTAIESIDKNLQAQKQSMILLNRRGTSTSVVCTNCGWIKMCSNCELPISFHQQVSKLICHTCGIKESIVHNCPSCSSTELTYRGIGTQKLEQIVQKLFPQAKIVRIDRDSFDHKNLHEVHQKLYDADFDIIIGTQMISKGLDLPHLQTVVIANADGIFNLPDFSSGERAFQLIYQSSGRSGRSKTRGQTIIQTYVPDHPIIRLAAETDYSHFYEYELGLRKKLHFPPFRYLMVVEASRRSSDAAAKSLKSLLAKINAAPNSSQLFTLGPAPRLHEKSGNTYRWKLIIKAKKRSHLLRVAQQLPQNFTYTLDPISIL